VLKTLDKVLDGSPRVRVSARLFRRLPLQLPPLVGIDASSTVESCRQPLCAARSRRPSREPGNLSRSWHATILISSQVSYLAQTRESAPVIIYSPECVERAMGANS
jgi:hypothetical protein